LRRPHNKRAFWTYTKTFTRLAQRAVSPLRPWAPNCVGVLDLALVVRAEQVPNPTLTIVALALRTADSLARLG